MKAVLVLSLLAAVGLTSCGSFREDRPLSRVDRDRGPLILDGPDRVRVEMREREDRGLLARSLPWNWF